MALTGKTIGELTNLGYTTNNVLIPVEESGSTYHIAFSGVNYSETTYSGLTTNMGAGQLSIGQYYLITDFKTCYDQPDYDYNGDPITIGNYKQGSVSPLLVLATDVDKISELAYQPQYSGDTIYYDPYFSVTEVTGGEAFGRITYRIDEKGNAFDYDFREVLFKRYTTYSSNDVYDGKVSIDSAGNVTGIGTFFTSLSPENIIGIVNLYTPYCVDFYEIVSIDTDTSMVVTGHTINVVSDTFYTPPTTESFMSYKQSNVISNTAFTEYNTFTSYDSCFNNTCGNRESNTIYEGHTFLLSNNVFRSSPYIDNSFGSEFRNNTFNDDCTGNTIKYRFFNNIIDNDFDNNIITSNFHNNMIVCDFNDNYIQNSFFYNNFGDYDGVRFNDNIINGNFLNNFFTGWEDFNNNMIQGGFQSNYILRGVNFNNIRGQFYSNILRRNVNTNTIGINFSNNTINGQTSNCTIGDNFVSNIISSNFRYNTVGYDFQYNNFGDPNNLEFYSFQYNTIGAACQNNYFSGDTQHNSFGDFCQYNNVDTNFSFNKIGSYFQSNTISNDFGFGGGYYRGNIVGNGFISNNIGEYCYDNTFGDICSSNTIGDNFINNKISYGMTGTIIVDYDAGSGFQNNNITFGNFSQDLTLSGGTGGNSILYTDYTTNIMKDASDYTAYVTLLSAGTIVAQPLIV